MRRKLVPNQKTHYKLDMSMKTTVTTPDGTPSPESDTELTGEYTMTLGDAVKDGKIPIEIKSSHMHVQSDSDTPSSDPADVVFNAFMDDRNTMSGIKVESSDPSAESMANSMSSMLNGVSAFPEKKVQPGDTWEVSCPLSVMGMKDIQLTLHFDGERTEDGQSYWVVHVDQDIPMEMDLAAVARATGQPGSTPSMTVTGTMHMSMEALFDKTGLTHSLQSETKFDMGVDGPQGGQVRIHTDQITKMTED